MAKTVTKTGRGKPQESELRGPQSEGLADAEGSQFWDPPVGDYDMVFTKPTTFTPADPDDSESRRGWERYNFYHQVVEGEAEDGSDVEGKYWNHAEFIPPAPTKDMGKEEAAKARRSRDAALSRVKSVFNAAGVKVVKDPKTDLDIWDGEAFVGKTIQVKVKPDIDKETGIQKQSDSGRLYTRIQFSKAASE